MYRLLIAAFLFATLAVPSLAAEWDYRNPPLAGDMVRLRPLPDPFYLPEAFMGTKGGGLESLDKYEGKLILLNLWATWCPPCIDELPSLNALQHAMKSNDFEVVTVSLDDLSIEKVEAFMKQYKLDALTPYIDSRKDIQSLGAFKSASGIPITMFIDNRMRGIALFEGDTDWNGRDARAVIEYYLKKMPATTEYGTGQ